MINAYAGWSNINYVLNDVKDPVRTLKIAGPLGLGITTVLYMMANVSYFACVPSLAGGETAAGTDGAAQRGDEGGDPQVGRHRRVAVL